MGMDDSFGKVSEKTRPYDRENPKVMEPDKDRSLPIRLSHTYTITTGTEDCPMTDLTWHALLKVAREATEGECSRMIEEELGGERRLRHLLRIHSRLNKLRADRERCELMRLSAERKG
jgi:hypothetical protein